MHERPRSHRRRPRDARGGVLDTWEADVGRPAVQWRRSGEDYLLVEYGPMVLDLELRFRVHALQQWLERVVAARRHRHHARHPLAPGALRPRRRRPRPTCSHLLQAAEAELPAADETSVESRIVHLPMSWDDPATREAIHRYMSTVRADAPWCPWNIEFIRRINGLESVDDVKRIVYDASYLVLGLGDVYLGAPVATPLDPRHRLVTTKYNPARTWTPENAVGIGGAYLCIYGMEGPGGYQFVGRTVPVWNRFRRTKDFTEPWLLRFFDQLRFFEVGADELLDWRRDVLTGRAELQVEHSTRCGSPTTSASCVRTRPRSATFRARQQDAFNAERGTMGRGRALPARATPALPGVADEPLPAGATVVEASLLASVWKVVVEVGQQRRRRRPAGRAREHEDGDDGERAGRPDASCASWSRAARTWCPGQALVALA